MMDEKVMKWRSSPLHRKCKYCKWLRYVAVATHIPSPDYYKCIAKDKVISDCLPDMTEVPRPFCRLFELNTGKRI